MKTIYTNDSARYFLVVDSETKESTRYYFDGDGLLAGFTREKLEQTLTDKGEEYVWA